MRNKVMPLALISVCAACVALPTQPDASDSPELSVIGADNLVGAVVLNRGEASEPFFGTCQFAGRITNDVTIVATANGGAIFKCHWAYFDAPDFGQARVIRDWTCDLTFPVTGFFGFTNKTSFVLSQAHTATATCIFQEAPVYNPPGGAPPTNACYGQITSGISSTWPWAHDGREFFGPPPGAIALWIQEIGGFFGITSVRELQLLFCG